VTFPLNFTCNQRSRGSGAMHRITPGPRGEGASQGQAPHSRGKPLAVVQVTRPSDRKQPRRHKHLLMLAPYRLVYTRSSTHAAWQGGCNRGGGGARSGGRSSGSSRPQEQGDRCRRRRGRCCCVPPTRPARAWGSKLCGAARSRGARINGCWGRGVQGYTGRGARGGAAPPRQDWAAVPPAGRITRRRRSTGTGSAGRQADTSGQE